MRKFLILTLCFISALVITEKLQAEKLLDIKLNNIYSYFGVADYVYNNGGDLFHTQFIWLRNKYTIVCLLDIKTNSNCYIEGNDININKLAKKILGK